MVEHCIYTKNNNIFLFDEDPQFNQIEFSLDIDTINDRINNKLNYDTEYIVEGDLY